MSESASIRTYPALRNLEAAQQNVVEDLREGFCSYEELFFWLQDLAVVTFGYISTKFLQSPYRNGVMRHCLTTGKGFCLYNPDHFSRIDPRKTRKCRLYLEEELNGVFQLAYRDLRSNANEYVDPDVRPAVDSENAPVALRPSLQSLNERQKQVLKELLNGFESDEEILDWGRRLNGATHGEVPTKLITGLSKKERVLRDNLLNDKDLKYATEHRGEFRHRFACVFLIPSFNKGIRTITGAAGEQSETDDSDDSDYSPELGA